MIRKIIRVIKIIIVGIYLTVASQLALKYAVNVGIMREDYLITLSFITGCINGFILSYVWHYEIL